MDFTVFGGYYCKMNYTKGISALRVSYMSAMYQKIQNFESYFKICNF